MTIDELNALYEAADFGNLGNYKAPTTTSNIDLTAPVVEGIPAIQPYIPPIIQNLGNESYDGKGPTQDPPIDPMSFGNQGIKGYNQLNIAGPVKGPGILESLLSLPGQAIGAYMKYGPLGQVKKGIEFLKEKQRVAAENQRLADEINAREQKRQIAIIQDRIDNDPRSAPPGRNNPYGGGPGGVQSNMGQSSSQAGADRAQNKDNQDTAGAGGYNKGGRISYSTGGIVTL